jgi:hypothetical protein
MLRHDRVEMAEEAWKEALGSLLIGTYRTAGDHFTMFGLSNSRSTTCAVQRAVAALEQRAEGPV